MKHASGLKTCTKIYFLDYLQPSVNKNSQNLATLTLQFDEVTVKTIYWARVGEVLKGGQGGEGGDDIAASQVIADL